MSVVTVRILIGGGPPPPPTARFVVVPNPITILPNTPATITVKLDDGTGALSDLLPSQMLVPFFIGGSAGIVTTVKGHSIELVAPADAVTGTIVDMSIDVR